jgi:hypothetical protein
MGEICPAFVEEEQTMISAVIRFLQLINDPKSITFVVWPIVIGYYIVSAFCLHFAKDPNYKGPWRKYGAVDLITSSIWCVAAIGLILSLLDLAIHNELRLGFLLHYFVLVAFLFAFLFNLLEWHWPGSLEGFAGGWAGELQCLILSTQALVSADFTSLRPKKRAAEVLGVLEAVLGLFFIAVFVAKAVSRMGFAR